MINGDLRKMQADVDDDTNVSYKMRIGDHIVPLNEYLGKKISLSFSGAIHCINCGKTSKKSFSQGFCFPCFKKLAACDTCIMSPEKCHFHKGTCREPEWAEKHCMQGHYVYLANSSALKVGITRGDQLPTRWLDQGATQARPIFHVANRRLSGLVETVFKDVVADKTNWRNMLKGLDVDFNLYQEQERLIEQVYEGLDALQSEFGIEAIEDLSDKNQTYEFRYPVLEYPTKVVSINAEKTPLVEGTLMGIKGQYWILDTGVINIRKYTGYEALLNI
ncbi:DUF2797 domain-containing protein [Marinomonas mediterranea]|jgi:Protein of unknown function (DUF2797).|uniref:DUF2797 domain-containing protein n=1 Tax=Marinomonas mediterranea (strain ATCC 700492 / JCM 21426 / NBRC 103028 / MMB-1) TaxID=717774 RepID=F2K3F8_MARM1|nr:DUF2797 domain-containing protein [Marinomonas mediterranea]ADZ91300.1 hypothetical protein Marme_2052 [Marinomonas mediterranea MMB-1]WCN09271.1 DUF2797 domain-containing protein [Marinomonas mediterranea]WCN13353.1 DUF2797 domain-containing protein [Marinomonas mediterranea]WCN17421.1 DUF2797 domain-containing protein [Marinomonas mediterranea MMB-1]